MTVPTILVWDASALHHPARADRIDVLADLARPYRNVTTAAVLEELQGYGLRDAVTTGGWLEEHRLDGLAAIERLGLWLERLGAGAHNRGEVTAAVTCELLGATALLDDHIAKKVMRAYGLTCHGTLWLAADAVTSQRVASARALDGFFSSLLLTGARFPFKTGPEWRAHAGLT